MSDSLTLATKRDFSAELQVVVNQAQELVRANPTSDFVLDEALQGLLAFEKKCRLNNDFPSLKEVCLTAVRLCYQYGTQAIGGPSVAKLNGTMLILSKRRSQNKTAITAIVQEAITYLDNLSEDLKVEVIKTLITICEGKMYVEGEGARLHLMLALIYESRNDMTAACDMIQDVHVETYGSLSKQEKAEYILEQIRLNLKKKDFIRTMIQSRKMNRKTIELEGFTQVKLKFYTMMMEYYVTHEKNAWEVCLCYQKIYECLLPQTSKTSDKDAASNEIMPTIAAPAEAIIALESCVIFLILSQYNIQSHDLLHRLKLLKNASKDVPGSNASIGNISLVNLLLTLFTTSEIIPQAFVGRQAVEEHECLHKFGKEYAIPFLEFLNKRIIEHNLRVISKSYARIRLNRIAQLLDLDKDVIEERLAQVATSGDIYVKINRPAGIVNFAKKPSPEEVLSDWGSDISKLLRVMESTCHLIHRENMVHKI